MPGKIYVTYCSKTKASVESGIPRTLYTSQRVRSFFNKAPRPRGILSYKYGFVPEFRSIENYEKENFGSAQEFFECIMTLRRYCQGKTVIFYSPRYLVEKPWLMLLDAAGVKYQVIRTVNDFHTVKLLELLSSKT